MDGDLPDSELFAIRYAERDARRYPGPRPELEGIVVRLDAMPRE
jgi:hypothetical protein